MPSGRVISPVKVPVARVTTVIQSPLPNWTGTWTVATPVHAAIAVLEQLSGHDLLFPATIVLDRTTVRSPESSARTTTRIAEDIGCFTGWVNQEFAGGTVPLVPPDPAGPINPRRFRRTLAYFIVRRPRGLIAAALQYGHISTRVTMSYAGTSDTSWTNDLAVERLELVIEQADRDWSLLQAEEHVSAAAAGEYRARVQQTARFAGLVVTSARRASRLLSAADPAIHHGEAVTCVWHAETAACRSARTESELPLNDAPEEAECRSGCRNLAYTDRDVRQIGMQAAAMRQRAEDPLAPRPVRDRAAARAAGLQEIIDRHEATRLARHSRGEGEDLMDRTDGSGRAVPVGGKRRDRDTEQAAITAAAERLLGGTPLRSKTGNLTVSELITESGLRRDIVYDHPHLIDTFKARVKARDSAPAALTPVAERDSLRSQLAAVKGELARERSTASILRKVIAELCLELDQAYGNLAAPGNVTPLWAAPDAAARQRPDRSPQ